MPGQPLRTVDAAALQRWCRRSTDALAVACAGIDALNVFPVPDGDTGTNLLVTMRAATEAATAVAGGEASEVARAAAQGSLAGARGSSGVILSRFLHGFAAGMVDVAPEPGSDSGTGGAIQAALTAGADAAYAAVAAPVEGTILSVARVAAKAARDADPIDLHAVVEAAAGAARSELVRTTTQLPALAAAGVVDAGGQGLVVLLDVLADVVAGRESTPDPVLASPVTLPTGAAGGASSTFAYEVQYLLDAPAHVLPALRERLGELGDAVAVVSNDAMHNVHVHVDDVGAAIEAGVEVGRPHRISVVRFADQSRPGLAAPTSAAAGSAALVRVVTVCPAAALADLFRAAGAVVVSPGSDGEDLAVALTDAARAVRPAAVVLLPNSRDLKSTADAAAATARAAGCATTVVPTRSPVQGLAAVAVHDPRRRLDDDAVAMSAAAAATRYAEVTRATYDALTSAGPCRTGDVLGLIDDDVAAIGDDVDVVARELLDRLLIGGGELVTIVAGADAPPALAGELADYLRATRPAVDTVVHFGGQPTYPILIGVE